MDLVSAKDVSSFLTSEPEELAAQHTPGVIVGASPPAAVAEKSQRDDAGVATVISPN